MKKITTVFKIDRSNNLATREVLTGNEWVITGQGVATIKFDGTACLIKNGVLFRRWNRKLTKRAIRLKSKLSRAGKSFVPHEHMFKPVPAGAILCNDGFDPKTYHWPHWIPVSAENPADHLHIEGFEALQAEGKISEGSFELCGPKVRCNPHNLKSHVLIKHGANIVQLKERSFDAIREYIATHSIEGLVFHHPDGRMAKVRNKDFDLPTKWNEQADPRDKKSTG